MAKKKIKQIEEVIYRFAEELKKEIPVEKILLFGSYAEGESTEESDIDVIVVSPAFEKGKYIKHMQYLFRKALKVSSLLEPIPASPSEIKNADKRVFLGQVVKKAKIYEFK